MCTAVTYQKTHFYFGRTLDYDISYGEEVVITPRNFPLPLRHGKSLDSHYAIIGMAKVAENFPLYFDAVNEKGLAMAGLNFPGNAHYSPAMEDGKDIASFELIPYILGSCASVAEAKTALSHLRITNDAFLRTLPPSPLHWIIADRTGCITVESTKAGLHVYPNPIGVLTNNPPFPQQLERLNDYLHVSPEEPKNLFSPELDLIPYSRGMGAMGLPGDLSSQSRFVRAAFTKLNSICDDTEQACISQFFHIMDTVFQTRGCCRLGDDRLEITRYCSCCSCDQGIYYYTTYENRGITAVYLFDEDLDSSTLISYPLNQTLAISHQEKR